MNGSDINPAPVVIDLNAIRTSELGHGDPTLVIGAGSTVANGTGWLVGAEDDAEIGNGEVDQAHRRRVAGHEASGVGVLGAPGGRILALASELNTTYLGSDLITGLLRPWLRKMSKRAATEHERAGVAVQLGDELPAAGSGHGTASRRG